MPKKKNTDNTVTKTDIKPWQFQPGQSGNPHGRPKGSRNKLSESFIEDLLTVWEEGGIDTLRNVKDQNPVAYLRVVASLVPKKFNVEDSDDGRFTRMLEKLSNEELNNLIEALQVTDV